ITAKEGNGAVSSAFPKADARTRTGDPFITRITRAGCKDVQAWSLHLIRTFARCSQGHPWAGYTGPQTGPRPTPRSPQTLTTTTTPRGRRPRPMTTTTDDHSSHHTPDDSADCAQARGGAGSANAPDGEPSSRGVARPLGSLCPTTSTHFGVGAT